MRKRRLSDDEKDVLVNKISAILGAKESIVFAYIFGSFVTGDEFQDLDVGIFLVGKTQGPSLLVEIGIERELENSIGVPSDVRVINGAPLSFIYNILKHKIVIVDKNEVLRSDFEGFIYKKYFDLVHLKREYLRELINAPV
jgi:uncharacterized protein